MSGLPEKLKMWILKMLIQLFLGFVWCIITTVMVVMVFIIVVAVLKCCCFKALG